MSDELETTETDEQIESTEHDDDAGGDDTPRERTFTQAEVEELIAKRLRRDRAKRSRQKNAEPKKEQAKAENAAPDSGEWRDRFYDAIDDIRLTKGQKRRMREAFKRENPSDPDAWVAEYCSDIGIQIGDESPETETKAKATDVPTGKPSSDNGPPQTQPDYDTVINPNQLTADDIRRMEQKYGVLKSRKKLREMAERYYRGRPIRIAE